MVALLAGKARKDGIDGIGFAGNRVPIGMCINALTSFLEVGQGVCFKVDFGSWNDTLCELRQKLYLK